MMKRIIKLILVVPLLFLFIQCNMIWTSPKTYQPERISLSPPVMSLADYSSSGLIATHLRPYVYTIQKKGSKGAVLVFGVEHTNDPDDKQLTLMKEKWVEFTPTVAMVEGRLGFLFSWMQDPVKNLGEGGFVANLARSEGVELLSWEPDREAEIHYLLEKYPAPQVAAFFSLRPYLNKYSAREKEEQDQIMMDLIEERTRYKGLKGTLTSLNQLDSIWNQLVPSEVNWRVYKNPGNGWPKGSFQDMFIEANQIRNIHMCQSIIELVNKGERVFISMGSSHAPRIEQTLKEMLK